MTLQADDQTVKAAEVSAFITHEAMLLDDARYEEWLALFAEDAIYWVPSEPQQSPDDDQQSLAREDLFLLRLRVERLRHPQAHSQKPRSRSLHVLQTSSIVNQQSNRVETRTPFIYTEQRGDDQLVLPGVARHQLLQIDEQWRIREKRVDLLAAGQALPMIQLFP